MLPPLLLQERVFLYSMGIGVATTPLIKESNLGSKAGAATEFLCCLLKLPQGPPSPRDTVLDLQMKHCIYFCECDFAGTFGAF